MGRGRLHFVRGVLALLVLGAFGSACQVALRAESEDAQCNLPEGTKCPGSSFTCQSGRCRPCTPRTELCNGIDDDCNGLVDDGYDKDGDGYLSCGNINPVDGSVEPNTVDCNDDPDNGGASVHPGASELCNGIDDNCNNSTDEGTCPGGECWPLKPGCASSGDCCTIKDDCRLHGCKTLGCDPKTGRCDAIDCTTGGCPPGFECDPGLKACIKVVAMGDPCSVTEICKSGICIDGSTFGLPAGRKVCSTACCMSEDCPSGFICKYAANAVSMCIRAADLSLTTGTAAAFAKCGTGKDCRSGVCSGGTCQDGCCGEVPCGAGGTCSLKTGTGADNRWLCREPIGGFDYESPCGSDGNCKTGLCWDYGWVVGRYCAKRACNSFDCRADERAVLVKVGDQISPVCLSTSAKVGTKKGGEACLGGSECRSGTCGDGRCSEFCCHDSDCDPATVCKPSASGPLRCLPKGA